MLKIRSSWGKRASASLHLGAISDKRLVEGSGRRGSGMTRTRLTSPDGKALGHYQPVAMAASNDDLGRRRRNIANRNHCLFDIRSGAPAPPAIRGLSHRLGWDGEYGGLRMNVSMGRFLRKRLPQSLFNAVE